MTVKNEAENIQACLAPIHDLFDQVQIMDTGSSDTTVSLLRDLFGFRAVSASLESERCYTLSDLRNEGFARLSTEWILCLDADERIDRESLIKFRQYASTSTEQGVFTPWRTRAGEDWIDDYKLSFFRKGFQKLGLVHDNVQSSFRQQGAQAAWYPDLVIEHYPAHHRAREKHEYYTQRLHCAIAKQPEWWRYYWFLGYRQYCQNDFESCVASLLHCANSNSDFFPVEVLNSLMVLASVFSQTQRYLEAQQSVEKALTFLELKRPLHTYYPRTVSIRIGQTK